MHITTCCVSLADKEGSQAVFRLFHAVSCPLCVNRDPPSLSRNSPHDVR